MDDTLAMPDPGDITLLLERVHLDEPGALEALCQRCLPEIRGIAHGALRQTVRSTDLHTTVVLHEVFIKLHGGSPRAATSIARTTSEVRSARRARS